MSFILDALKKSENERQKQSSPALFEVKVAAPARRFPVWAIVVGVLLGVNLVVLIAVLLLRERQDPAVQATQAQIAAARAADTSSAPGGMPQPAPGAPSGGAQSNSPVTPPTGPAAGNAAGNAANTAAAALIGPDGLPVAGSPAYGDRLGTPIATGAPDPRSAASSRFNPPLIEDDDFPEDDLPVVRGTPITPADYAPAIAGPSPTPGLPPQPAGYPMPADTGPAQPPGRGTTTRASGIPSRDDLMASGMGDLPPATVGLHVYDRNPAARFVFVNGARAREGDVLQNGLRVDEITPEGTVLSFRGSRFLVPIQ